MWHLSSWNRNILYPAKRRNILLPVYPVWALGGIGRFSLLNPLFFTLSFFSKTNNYFSVHTICQKQKFILYSPFIRLDVFEGRGEPRWWHR